MSEAWPITIEQNLDRLPMWVVYDHPSDYPLLYVARLHFSLPEPEATQLCVGFKDLERLRTFLSQRACICLPRRAEDDPVIVETWIV